MIVRTKLLMQALLLVALVLAAVFTGVAWASPGGLPSSEFVWGSLLTVGIALASGYTWGVDKRIDKVETRAEARFRKVEAEVATAISLTNGHRQILDDRITHLHTNLPRPDDFARAMAAIDRLHERLDQLFPLHRGPHT